MDELLEARLARIVNLPCAEWAAARVLKLGENPDLTAEDILGVLEGDVALAATLLRMANSPLYAQRRLIGSLRQAILELTERVSLTVLLESLQLTRTHYARNTGKGLSVWRRSRVTGVVAALIGQAMQEDDIDALYMAGLLRDIGILALLKTYPESYTNVLVRCNDHGRLLEMEQNEWGTSHVEVGAWIAKHWRLPPIVTDTIGLTHHPESLDGFSGDHRRRLACVWLAALITDWCLDGEIAANNETDKMGKRLSDVSRLFSQLTGIMDELNVTAPQFQVILDKVTTALPKALQDTPHVPWTAEQRRTFHEQRRHVLRLRRFQKQQALEKIGAKSQYLHARNMVLEETARRDGMTALFNRSYFNEVLKREFTLSQSYNSAFNLALIDLDRFKAVNDNSGHPVGDRLLAGVASALQSCVRDTDIIARFGGDEFALIAPGTRTADATRLCERLLSAVREYSQINGNGEQIATTASIGLITEDQVRDFSSIESLMIGVDDALYAAKRNGGDQLVLYTDTKPSIKASEKPRH